MTEWKPIETAPTDRQILLWVNCELCERGEGHAHNCVATGYPTHGVHLGRYMAHPADIYFHKTNFTHWMEIPEPPRVTCE